MPKYSIKRYKINNSEILINKDALWYPMYTVTSLLKNPTCIEIWINTLLWFFFLQVKNLPFPSSSQINNEGDLTPPAWRKMWKKKSLIFLESFNSSYLTCPKTAKAFSCLTSLWCGSVSIQVCLFYTVHWRHADQSPTVTPVDFEMNLQQCRRKGHNDSKDIGTDVEHTLVSAKQRPQQQLRIVLDIGIHPWCH